jgi:large subunit ribosomal protein L30
MAKKEKKPARLRITLVRSPIGYPKRQKATVQALGLRRMHQTVEHDDVPEIRGMVNKIIHMVQVEEVN